MANGTNGGTSSSPPASSVRTYRFFAGQAVEIMNKPPGSYYEAVVVDHVDGNGPCVVHFNKRINQNGTYSFSTKMVFPINLRPAPPLAIVPPEGYSLNQKVDAYIHEGWWVTTVTARRGSDYYSVYWEFADEEVEFHSSQLRLHQEWIGGCWVLG